MADRVANFVVPSDAVAISIRPSHMPTQYKLRIACELRFLECHEAKRVHRLALWLLSQGSLISVDSLLVFRQVSFSLQIKKDLVALFLQQGSEKN
jgi:hypothetical protein